MISPWFPWPPFDGARIRILETLKYLAERHEVTFLSHVQSTEEAASVGELESLCRDVRVAYLPGSAIARLRRIGAGSVGGASFIESIHFAKPLARIISGLTAEQDFDIVHVEFSFLARYTTCIDASSRAKRVLSTHNIESQRFAREIELLPWGFRKFSLLGDARLFPKWEQKALANFDGATAVSEQDVAWIRQHRPGLPTRLIPNGVDTSFFSHRDEEPTGEPSIVFTGVMDYPPNVDAVIWFANTAWPRIRARQPSLRFNIVGAKPSQPVQALAAVEGINVTGAVDDIRPYVRQARAFVVPLRSGGGTRLKILQALSMGCPVISSRLGAEGLDVRDGEHLLYADAPDDFLAAIDRLLGSPDEAVRLGKAGRALVSSKYDWRSCLSGLEALYAGLSEQE